MGIILDKVSHQYINNVKSIDNISIDLEDNEINGIIGKSGSGKTTLLELIDSLLKPISGKITVNDNTSNKDIRKEIGFLFQFPEEQFFEENVKKEINFALKNFKNKKNKVIDALRLVGLNEEYLNKKLNELSSGEKRLVAMASILVYNPKIILLDEPTVGLDNKNKNKIIKIIKMLKNKYDKTIIIVSHDIDMLYNICDKLIVIDNGKLIMYGDTDSIYKEKDIIKKYSIIEPKIIQFEKLVKEKKNIKLMHTTCINDLIKEVYRNA